MKPASFAYYRPQSVPEMLDLLAEHGEEGKILAGGQSLVPAMNFRLARPATLLDVNGLTGLDYLNVENGLRIGALTRHAAFHRRVADGALSDLLAETVRHIGHYPIRQRGTFAGSLAHADPASEWCLLATVLDAKLIIASRAGERSVDAGDFFRGAFSTALKPDELLMEIRLPALGEGWRAGFYEFSRRAGDFALAMAATVLRVQDGRIVEGRLGVGAVASRPIRLEMLERDLVGQAPDADLFRRIGLAARDLVDPIEDIHGSAEYRRDLTGTVVTRALAKTLS